MEIMQLIQVYVQKKLYYRHLFKTFNFQIT
jgi:hypothetical protein